MPRASHKGTSKPDKRGKRGKRDKRGKREFKAKEQDLSRCEGYMYRRKGSAKLDRILGSLKERAFQ